MRHAHLVALALVVLAGCASTPPYQPRVEGTGRDGIPYEQHLADCREHGRNVTSAGLAATRVAVTSVVPGAVVGAGAGALLGSGAPGYGASGGARDGAAAGAIGAAAGGALAGAASVPTGVTAYEAAVDECLGWRGYRVVR